MIFRQRHQASCRVIQSTGQTDLLAGLEEQIEHSGRSREEILQLVIVAQHNHIQDLQNEIEQLDMLLDEPPRRSWTELGLAGLAGFWLGGGFSRDEEY